VLDHVKHHPDKQLDQIADEMKASAKSLVVPMKLLLREMSITKRGRGRQAVYCTPAG